MRRGLISAVLFVVIDLFGLRYALAGQAPAAASG
jgi:hypothetical protein